jgi:hypothetical protein
MAETPDSPETLDDPRLYPSILQYRHVLKELEHHGIGSMDFCGTVKLHGTHADILQSADGQVTFQSRNRALTAESDNMGFAAAMSRLDLGALFAKVRARCPDAGAVMLCGEYCGGSIQKGVALSKLDRMFVVFDIRVDGAWQDMRLHADVHDESQCVFNILQFPTYDITVDVANPESASRRLVELTEAVEARCPVGAHFGVEGIGEGIVWKPRDMHNRSRFWFKVKGGKHSVVRVRPKDIAATDVLRMKDLDEFADRCVSEPRCQQAFQAVGRDVGAFLRWIGRDVAKEEADTIEAHAWTPKAVNVALNERAKAWLRAQCYM